MGVMVVFCSGVRLRRNHISVLFLCHHILTYFTRGQKNDTNLNLHKVCCFSFYDDNLIVIKLNLKKPEKPISTAI